jgi:hypothetical protein
MRQKKGLWKDTIKMALFHSETVKTINKTIVRLRNVSIYFFSIWEKFRQLVLLTISKTT